MPSSSAARLAPRPGSRAPPRQGLLIAKQRWGGALLGPSRSVARGGAASRGALLPSPSVGQVAQGARSLVVTAPRARAAVGPLGPPRSGPYGFAGSSRAALQGAAVAAPAPRAMAATQGGCARAWGFSRRVSVYGCPAPRCRQRAGLLVVGCRHHTHTHTHTLPGTESGGRYA